MTVSPCGVIDRCCFRCRAEFPTGSRQARVYCPACVSTHSFPAPVEPVVARRRVAAATSDRRDVVTVRTRCEVCGGHVKAGQSRCGRCLDQLAIFSTKIDRRRREWRDED